MHDPSTLAFNIRWPIRIDIWHEDPCKDGTDDSCGWHMRARHGDKAVLEKIVKRFEFDWDRTFTSEGTGKTYACGYFTPAGYPYLSVHAIGLNLFFLAALEVFGSRDKAVAYCQKRLFEILFFAENPFDSLHGGFTQKFGEDVKRDDRICQTAGCIYAWILNDTRPWWRHPKWHVRHWNIRVHCIGNLKRWLFSRCAHCGKRFKYGASVCTNQWNNAGPAWFKGERNVFHEGCMSANLKQPVKEPKA